MNCLILDDELPAIQELSYFILNFSSIEISAKFTDSIKALQYVQNNFVDVIFLDINMPKLNGLDFCKVINSLNPKPAIVFLTAYREYSIEAFEIAAFDYVLKPYSENRIVATLSRLEHRNCLGNTVNINGKLPLWKNGKIFVININDISYCKSYKHDIFIYVGTTEYKTNSSIKEFYKKLPQDRFFQCHRSYIVNLDKINEIIPWFNNTYILKLQDIDYEIPVSRQNLSIFKQIMGI